MTSPVDQRPLTAKTQRTERERVTLRVLRAFAVKTLRGERHRERWTDDQPL